MTGASVPYDPAEDEGRNKPSHVSIREIRIFAIVVAIVIILLIPVYRYLLDLRNSSLCVQNLHDIDDAIGLYANDNNDRFPPLYMATDDQSEPKLFNGGHVFSWVSLLSRYTKNVESFHCPAAQDNEGVTSENGDVGAPIVSDYGMYGALSSYPVASLASPSTEAVIADSSNRGANGTFDPLPFPNEEGYAVPDGFILGLDTSNFSGTDSNERLFRSAKAITRLAYPDSASEGFKESTPKRHPDGVHVLYADHHLGRLPAPIATVRRFGKFGEITGMWTIPQ